MAVRWSGMRRPAGSAQGLSASGEQWTITSAQHRATLVEMGGGLRSYEVNGVPLVAPFSEEDMAPAAAGQVMAPWPNRIGDGRYTFRGREYQLPLDEPERGNAIHGLTRWLPWECVERLDDTVRLVCRLLPRPGYPWPLEISTRWSISADGLRATHEVTNLGDEPCPFGVGAHPYVWIPGVPVSQLALQVPGTWRLVTDERMLPVSRQQVAGTEYDFRSPRVVGAARLDTSFARLLHGADGTARTRLYLPDGSFGVEVWQDLAFKWLQVYNGGGVRPEGEAIAVEPMTCPPDAFRSREDVIVLQPGQSWAGSWGIRPYA